MSVLLWEIEATVEKGPLLDSFFMGRGDGDRQGMWRLVMKGVSVCEIVIIETRDTRKACMQGRRCVVKVEILSLCAWSSPFTF